MGLLYYYYYKSMVTRKNRNKSHLARVNQQQNQQSQFSIPDNNQNSISAFSFVLGYLFGKLKLLLSFPFVLIALFL